MADFWEFLMEFYRISIFHFGLLLRKSSKKFLMTIFQRILEDIFATISNFYVFDQDPAVATGLDRPVLTGDWS